MADPKEPKVDARPITIYDSVHSPPGTTLPNQITFSFGAASDGMPEHRLFDLPESELTERLLNQPLLLHRLLPPLGIEYPNCWIVSEILTKDVTSAWSQPKPGDLDIVCGNVVSGKPQFDSIVCIQIKIRKVKTFDETGDFASGSGTTQAYWTAKMGFDRTLLLHFIVRVPQPLPEGYAPSWNAIVNANFERAAKSCFGVIRERFVQGRELYGYGWIGWGQAFGNRWDTCGGLAVDLVYPPPVRPASDSGEAIRTRTQMVESFRRLISRQETGTLPIVVRCKRH